MLADEMGLGKTAQAIGVINKIKAKSVLIIAPSFLKYNWKAEIEKWITIPYHIEIIHGEIRRDSFQSDEVLSNEYCLIVIVSYGLTLNASIFKYLMRDKFIIGILDESHYVKSPKAKCTKQILKKRGLIHNCDLKMLLTGTPMLNRPSELYTILKSLAPDSIAPYTTRHKFEEHFCDGHLDQYGRWNAKGASNLDELNKILKPIMLRRLKKDVLTQLPDKSINIVRFQKTQRVENEEEKMDNDLGAIPRIRKIISEDKTATVIKYIQHILNTSNRKVVVFAYHIDLVDAIYKQFHKIAVAITGSTPLPRREQLIWRFQNDAIKRLFIGQIKAAGVGITLTAASHVIFAEPSWCPGELDQAMDRCHRIGQTEKVHVTFLIMENTIEEYQVTSVDSKRKVIHNVVDKV